jgi:hypothetical protein
METIIDDDWVFLKTELNQNEDIKNEDKPKDFNLPLPSGNDSLSKNLLMPWIPIQDSLFLDKEREKNGCTVSYGNVYSPITNKDHNMSFDLGFDPAFQVNILITFDTLPDNFDIYFVYEYFEKIALSFYGFLYENLTGSILSVLEQTFYNENYQRINRNIQEKKLSYIIPFRSTFIKAIGNNNFIRHLYQHAIINIKTNPAYDEYNPCVQIYALQRTAHVKNKSIDNNKNLNNYYNEIYYMTHDLTNSDGIINLYAHYITSGLIVFRKSLDNKILPIEHLNIDFYPNEITLLVNKSINYINKQVFGFDNVNENVFIIPFDEKFKEIYYNTEVFTNSNGCVNLGNYNLNPSMHYKFPDNEPSKLCIMQLYINELITTNDIIGKRYSY